MNPLRSSWAKAPQTSAGPIASSGRKRNVASHLPRTIERVDSGVESRTSRLPLRRSSENDREENTASTRSPNTVWMSMAMTPANPTRGWKPSTKISNAPWQQAMVLARRRAVIRICIGRDDRARCHSRQRTGLPSSDGPGRRRVSRPIRLIPRSAWSFVSAGPLRAD